MAGAMNDPVLVALLLALVVVVFVGALQVLLDARARRKREASPEFVCLHIETNGFGPLVVDQTGRRLKGVKAMKYHAHLDAVDRLFLEVMAHDGQGYLINGRSVAPTRTTGPRP
ncbi:MAG TPA: hypothetical protein VFD43_06490 [Planctomycetota bacterium]|nr:hypothetical protein [Planctomycetota bacterium]